MSNETMSNADKTKIVVKYLGILAEKGFVVNTTDFATGQILVSIPELDAELTKVDPNGEHPTYKLVPSEMELGKRGGKVDAIKALRDRTGVDLATAKTIVEAFVADFTAGKVKG